VTGWTDNGDNTWTLGDYTFSEATGVLSAVPEPSALALLCAASAFTGIAIYRRRRVVNCQERMR
jgi:hypothetical protein